MANFKLALDAGHGLSTPGKRCMKALDPSETREWTINSRICNYIETMLADYDGIEILRVDDRTGKDDVSLSARCKKANDWKADLYGSFHHNAGVDGDKGGGSVIYRYPNSKMMPGATLKAIYDSVVKSNGLKGNRATPVNSAAFTVLAKTNMPAFLLECGFMDSKTDTPIILTEDFAYNTAAGFVDWIVPYAKLTKKVVVPEASSIRYRVQCGSFSQKSNADKLAKELKSRGYSCYVTQVEV